jgi:hypothetical protein
MAEESFKFSKDFMSNIVKIALEHNYNIIKSEGVSVFLDVVKQAYKDIPNCSIGAISEEEHIARTIPFELLHENQEYEVLEVLKKYEKAIED